MNVEWRDNYEISVRCDNGTVIVSANKEGLLSLADIFTKLAEGEAGDHIHLDEYNALEENSSDLIIEKTDIDI